MSGATARYPAAASAGSWCRHEYHGSGKPWHRITGGPSPSSATCSSMPSTETWRCVIALLELEHQAPRQLAALGLDPCGERRERLDVAGHLRGGRVRLGRRADELRDGLERHED